MATRHAMQHEPFRLGMLIHDTRYRNTTIQVLAFLLFAVCAAWLIDNMMQNLAVLGKDFSFDFLWRRAGYDISQQPIAYTSTSTHARAALVGLVNTLIVAAAACAAATLLGVFAGILRLSRNWIVARLMTVYVESFRNIPALLWIIVIAAVMSESMPTPAAFRGAHPSASMVLWNSVAVTNRGVYLPMPGLSRSLGHLDFGIVTLSLDFLAIVGVLALSWAGRSLLRRRADRAQAATGRRPATGWKNALILVAPVTALLYLLGFHLQYPSISGLNFSGGLQLRSSFIALWLGLSVYTGAFIAEIVRAGILAISRGQTEAAHALGLSSARTMRLVILPQAMRIIVPPLISQFLNITKNTSLGLAVGYMDLRSTLGGITINQTGRELEGMMLMMLIYVCISLVISSAMNLYNHRTRLKER